MAIVYLKHPVDAETKRKHNANGDRIVDIKFKPEGEKPAEAPKAKKAKAKKAAPVETDDDL